jgi:F-type H+-transporting ATPase subunit delta
MSDRAIAYAEAFLGIAQAEGQLERLEDELFRVARAYEGNDALRSSLTDVVIPVERRMGIVEDLLGAKAAALTTAMVSFLVGAGRARELPAVADAFVARAAEYRQEAVAEVRSAIPLSPDQQARLAQALGQATGKRVTVKVVVDPSVMGGLIARVGDTVIDGSVRSRLDQMKESL